MVAPLTWYHQKFPYLLLFFFLITYDSLSWSSFPPTDLPTYEDLSTNSTDLYYLHPNENPSVVLVSLLLDNKNYHSWERSMHIALISKNKERFIDRTLPKPTSIYPLYAPRIRCNTMVLAWLQRSITESIAIFVLWIDYAVSVWINLKTYFSQSGIFWISDIQEKLYKLRQGSMEIFDYFTKLKVLWDELENYRPVPHCKCVIQCSCDDIYSLYIYRDQDYIIRFLKGLNEKLYATKFQIMLLNPPYWHSLFYDHSGRKRILHASPWSTNYWSF